MSWLVFRYPVFIIGYNSNLSNKNFIEKRDRKNKEGKYIDFKNNLSLNKDIENKDHWNVNDIKDRIEKLIQ